MTAEIQNGSTLDFQRRGLALWLEEWRVYKALAAVSVPEGGGSAGKDSAVGGVGLTFPEAGGRSQPLRVGQVRLLRPAGMNLLQQRPVYVVLLMRQGVASWLVAPFGRFANPAVPGEWRTGLRSAPLRVLCLWNARVVSHQALESAWLSRRLTATQAARALAVWQTCADGMPLESVLAQRIGPPLQHPLDPRHEYLQEERELLDEHFGVAQADEASGADLVYEEMSQSVDRKAAEDRGRYGRDGDCRE